jgi:hypothetical protein
MNYNFWDIFVDFIEKASPQFLVKVPGHNQGEDDLRMLEEATGKTETNPTSFSHKSLVSGEG